MTSLAVRTAEIQAEIETLQVELARAEREAAEELQRVAGDVVLHLVTEHEAAKRRVAIERDLGKRRDQLRLLQESLPEIERRRLAAEEQARLTKLAAARKVVADNVATGDRLDKKLSSTIKAVTAALYERDRHRPFLAEAQAAEAELLRGLEVPTPVPDEGWQIAPDALELLVSGPVRPNAVQEENLREVEAARAQRDREMIEWFAVRPTTALLRELPERLRQRGEAILAEHEEKAAEQRRKREERDKARSFNRVGERRSRPPAPISG